MKLIKKFGKLKLVIGKKQLYFIGKRVFAQAKKHTWKPNVDASSLTKELYFPIENVYIPNEKYNPVYQDTIKDYSDNKSSMAVLGRTTKSVPSPNDNFWKKLTDAPINKNYSILLVDDGVHRCHAAKIRGDKWVRAHENLKGFSNFDGGVSVKDYRKYQGQQNTEKDKDKFHEIKEEEETNDPETRQVF